MRPAIKSKANSDTKNWIQSPSDDIAVNKHDCYFDHAAANRVKCFLHDHCRHSKGPQAGQPFDLLEWQWKDLVAPAYGWKLPNGSRRIRSVDCFIPKKNGKSTLCAGLALYGMSFDFEMSAEVFLAAYDRGQAGIVFNEANLMVEASEALDAAFVVKKTKKEIHFPDTSSFIRALSKESKSAEGMNIHHLIFDELHTQRDRLLWAALRYGGASRRQPMTICISTAGAYDETALWYEVFEDAKKLKAGKVIDIHKWVCLYYAAVNADWHDEKVWRAANPSYDSALDKVQFNIDYQKALKNGVDESDFKRYRLNMPTKFESAWIQNKYWVGCHYDTEKPDTIELAQCDLVVAGLDLSEVVDLNGMAFVGRQVIKPKSKLAKNPEQKVKDGNPNVKYIVANPIFWCPEEAGIAHNQMNRERYLSYFQSGSLRQIAGAIAQQNVIMDDIVNSLLQMRSEEIEVAEISIDRYQAMDFGFRLQAQLKSHGLSTRVRLVGYNFVSMNEPTKLLEEIIIGGLLTHDGNEILDWMFSNVQAVTDSNGNRKLDKSNKGKKIDGIAGICLGLRSFMEIDMERKQSKYNNPDNKLSTRSTYQ